MKKFEVGEIVRRTGGFLTIITDYKKLNNSDSYQHLRNQDEYMWYADDCFVKVDVAEELKRLIMMGLVC